MIEEKIMKVFANSGLSRIAFAEKLGISNAVLSHLSSGRNKASLDLVITLLKHFPDISTDWLVLNKGDMLRENEQSLQDVKKHLLQHTKTLKQSNHLLSSQIAILEKEIEELK